MLVEIERDRQPQRRWSFDRDMEIRRHVGDYALFTSGFFRPWVERQDLVGYYFEQGRQAYRALAEMAELRYAAEEKLFRALGEGFEHLSGALDYVRKVYMRFESHQGPYEALLRHMEPR